MTDDMVREPLQARIYLGEEITMAESAENIVRSHLDLESNLMMR